ncbi:unnamed protein product [Xylocopa violacea]|uniref:Adenylate kinase n=1 Tax=Xylocopa violacea TaxID=135666 RepID=A0ABP1PH70_XYLVO
MGICFEKYRLQPSPAFARLNLTPLKESRAVIIFVVGGPGAGKSTLCKRLAAKYGMTLILVSDILREEIRSGSEQGQYFKMFMDTGDIVPANPIVQLVVEKMLANLNTTGYLVVGFPRDKKQAVLFNTEVRQPDLMLNLYARRLILQDRMAMRSSSVARFDDTPEAICNRLIQYYANIKRAIAPNKRVTKTIDAELGKEEVFAQVSKLVEETLTRSWRS